MRFRSMSRREFVAAGLTAFPAFGLFASHRVEECGHDHPRHGGADTHPKPRPGITSERVLTADQLKKSPGAIAAFDEVRQIPQIIDGIRCQCGCAGHEGFYSLLTCYEGETAMAKLCEVCRGQGCYAFRLHKSGKTLDGIRAAIDARYG